MESAFRGFDVVMCDGNRTKLANVYQAALTDKVRDHVNKRKEIYATASTIFAEQFLQNPVLPNLTGF